MGTETTEARAQDGATTGVSQGGLAALKRIRAYGWQPTMSLTMFADHLLADLALERELARELRRMLAARARSFHRLNSHRSPIFETCEWDTCSETRALLDRTEAQR